MFTLAVFAFLVRIIYILQSRDDPTFLNPLVDSRTYHKLAEAWSQNGVFNEHFLWQAVFYPSFLAGVYKVFGVTILAAKIIQALLGGFTCLLTFKLGKKLFSPVTAGIAAFIVAIYGPLLFFESQLLATGWSALWLVTLCFLAVKTSQRSASDSNVPSTSGIDGLLFGLVAALAILTRPTFVPLIVGLIGWLLWHVWRKHNKLSLSLVYAGAVVCSLTLVLGSTALVLHRTTGHSGILPPSGGINLYIGNNPDFDETICIRPGLEWEDLLGQPRKSGYAPDPWSGQPYFTDKVKTYVKNEPLDFLLGLGKKALHLVSSRELLRTTDIYLHRNWSLLLQTTVFKIGSWGFPWGLLFPLVVVGMWQTRRQVRGPVLLVLLLYSLSLIVVFSNISSFSTGIGIPTPRAKDTP